MKNYLLIILGNLRYRKLRSWLTMIGIFIGIAAVVSLISLGQGLQAAIQEEFEQMGTNKIMIEAGGLTLMPGAGIASETLQEGDVDVIERVKGVDYVAKMLYKTSKTEFNDEVRYTFIIGMPTDDEASKIFSEMQSVTLSQGRELKSTDNYKAVIGSLINEGDLFDKEVRLRDRITIQDKEFKVIGIYEPVGNPQDDKNIYIPYDTARDLFDLDEVGMLIVQTIEGVDVGGVAEAIKKDLRDYRNVDEGEEDFMVQTFEEVIESFNTIFGMVQAVIIGIAAISLLVGGIGITNTMYTSVLERTKDIGIMKAVGAKNSDILKLFLIESGMLGLIGGFIGVVIGFGLSKTVEIVVTYAFGFEYLKAHFPWYLIIGALAFSFVVGSISGVFPARQAAKMKPVEALRYE